MAATALAQRTWAPIRAAGERGPEQARRVLKSAAAGVPYCRQPAISSHDAIMLLLSAEPVVSSVCQCRLLYFAPAAKRRPIVLD